MEPEDKEYTLVFCRRPGEDDTKEILLGMKKRGFGLGKWNGFGGKIEQGETIEEAAARELREECGLICNSLERAGYLVFQMEEDKKTMRVHVFQTTDFSGELVESDEMRPMWYKEDALPFEKMWADDSYWVPYLLANKRFIGRFTYEDDDTIIEHSIREP